MTVGGECYGKFDVNYVLFGRMVYNCGNDYDWALALIIGHNADMPWERSMQKMAWFDWGYNGGGALPSSPQCFSQLGGCRGCGEKWPSALAWRASGGGVVIGRTRF